VSFYKITGILTESACEILTEKTHSTWLLFICESVLEFTLCMSLQPCFEPQLGTPKSRRAEDKKTLLGSMEESLTSSACEDELH
jgi:hypothetical protein